MKKPGKQKTVTVSFRLPAGLKKRLARKAKARGVSMTAVVVAALERVT